MPAEFDRISFPTSRALLDYLRLSNSWWTPRRGYGSEWIFRGHGQAHWKLLPKAFRRPQPALFQHYQTFDYAVEYSSKLKNRFQVRENLEEVGNTFAKSVKLDPTRAEAFVLQVIAEIAAVREFAHLADSVGFQMPGSPPPWPWIEWANSGQELSFIVDKSPFVPGDVVALAQHHGIPTRLLDWTSDPLVAAFFAAEAALELIDVKSEEIAIWALARASVPSPGPQCIDTQFSSNQFARSQRGLFTVDPVADVHFCVTGEYPSLDESVVRVSSDAKKCLRKITLPLTECPSLLQHLWDEGISRLHLRPSLDNVVHTLQTKWSWGWKSSGDPDGLDNKTAQ